MTLMRLTGPSLVLAVSTLPTAMPLYAKEPTEDTVTVPGADGKSEQLICRRVTPVGTRVRGPKVCRTKEEWQEEQAQARDKTRELQRTRNATNGN